MWTRFAALCVELSLVSQAAAQQSPPPDQPTFRAEVSVVEVVAVVTGEDDRSLTDLTASDFELTEDGDPRELLSVRRLTTSTTTADRRTPVNVEGAYVEQLATNADVADAPVFVLLLDDLDTSPYDNHRMVRAAEGALAAIPDTALVAVATTSGVDGSLLTLARPGPEHVKSIRGFRGRLLLRQVVRGAARRPAQSTRPAALAPVCCSHSTAAIRRAPPAVLRPSAR